MVAGDFKVADFRAIDFNLSFSVDVVSKIIFNAYYSVSKNYVAEGALPAIIQGFANTFPACATRDNAGAIDIPNAEFVFKCSVTGEENFVSR